MRGWKQTFFAGCEALARWLAGLGVSGADKLDRAADWFGERAR